MSSIQRTRKLALVDCNSFYVSCERLFNPKIRKKPVVVLSNNDGCIISRSNEAKALGIKMGEPYFKAKDIIVKNKVEVFSSNYSLYGDLSRRVMRTLKRFNSDIEVYSIDEAFIDLSNFPNNDRARQGLAKLSIHKKTDSSQKYIHEAVNHLVNLFNQGQIIEVARQAETLLKQYPQEFIIWNILGGAYITLKEYDQALKAQKKVIELTKSRSQIVYKNFHRHVNGSD